MKDGLFEIGDLVQHKANKEKGIVTYVSRHCVKHTNFLQCLKFLECEDVEDGLSYKVSTGLKDPITIEGFLLEAASD